MSLLYARMSISARLTLVSLNAAGISVGNQVVTNELRKQFHARFVKILNFPRKKNASEVIPNFTSILFDDLLKS